MNQGARDIILVDSRGTIYAGRKDLNPIKVEIAKKTNKRKIKGGLSEAFVGADVFIGVSAPNIVNEKMVAAMNKGPIIFAMANPIPEIMPDKAFKAGAFIVGTGRSDFPNQINNALVFPNLFRGLLGGKVRKVTTKIKVAAAVALAYSVKPKKDKLLPLVTDKKAVKVIARAVVGNK
jgi:malate dehydrogenase (oxaloacetate-decarboxylating)